MNLEKIIKKNRQKRKIEHAEKRIKELKLLIKLWKKIKIFHYFYASLLIMSSKDFKKERKAKLDAIRYQKNKEKINKRNKENHRKNMLNPEYREKLDYIKKTT